jgi:DNA mismatch repair ATPase MutS
MKTFLMYRDRDFDPQHLLCRKETLPRSRSGEDEDVLRQLLPWNEEALTQDLALNTLCNAMATGDAFSFHVAKTAILSSLRDENTILYRQQVLSDCLNHAPLVREMYQIALEAIQNERRNYLGLFSRYPAGVLHRSTEVMQMFVSMLKRLRRIADQDAGKFASEGFSQLFSTLRQELSDEYLAEVEAHLKQVKFRYGVLISAELGKGNKGRNYVLRKPQADERNWFARLLGQKPPAYTFRLHPRDESGFRALAELKDRGINLVGNALAQSCDHVLSFFQTLRTELAFYIGCLNLHTRLAELGEPTCLPVPVPTGQRTFSFSGLYDVSLALSMGRKVVGNDLSGDDKELFVITGANTGGKSTFLRSVGLAQLMMQAGMFVPAESFSSELCDGLYTHYKREEDAAMESGKWDEELSRMSGIVDALRPNSLVLLNESFASTNEREGSEIARQIVSALLDNHVKVFFVTHLYQFARGAFEQNQKAVFLRAERLVDGTRPFKLIEAEPLQTSYGEDLYKTIFRDGEETKSALAKPGKQDVGERRSRTLPA